MSDFHLRRLGVLMEPEPGNPLEAEGVLNPAAARGPDGQLYLIPRLVARGTHSRIPELQQEREGIVSNVVFPTGIDRRNDVGSPDRYDVYYGMADERIGVARLDVPEHLPSDGLEALSPS